MKKILFFLIIYLYILCNNCFAKYNLNFELECFEIIVQRDTEPPKFEIMYSNNEWTNQDVIVKVKVSEDVQEIEGFSCINKNIYERVVKENESNEIKVLDLSGNEGILNYSVTNIDKNPPEIIGIENYERYYETKKVEFIDNESGIDKIDKIFYGDLLISSNFDNDIDKSSVILNVVRAPKNIVNFKYYRLNSGKENYIISKNKELKFNDLKDNLSKYYVIATDIEGNTFKSNIVSNNMDSLQNNNINYLNETNNDFLNSGNYDVLVKDRAGNITNYTITIDLNY